MFVHLERFLDGFRFSFARLLDGGGGVFSIFRNASSSFIPITGFGASFGMEEMEH